MRITFDSRGADGSQMRNGSEARLRLSMCRMTAWMPRAAVQYSDLSRPRIGVHWRCQVELGTKAGGTVVIASRASHRRTALDRSLSGATEGLTRSV